MKKPKQIIIEKYADGTKRTFVNGKEVN